MRFDGRLTRARPEATVAPAWLLRDITHVPGVLSLDGDRCRFVSTRRVVFDATPDELALATSRTRRGRFRLTVDGERVGLSVVRPAGAVPVPVELLTRARGGGATPAPVDTGSSADVAARWERLLVADAPGRHLPGPVTRARRRADRVSGSRRPRAWRAVTALVPRLPLVGGRPRHQPHRDRTPSPVPTA